MGALEVLLISFGAGVAPAGCTVDCDVATTAGAMLLAAPPVFAALVARDRLLAIGAAWIVGFGRLRRAAHAGAAGLPNALAVAGSRVNNDVSTVATRGA